MSDFCRPAEQRKAAKEHRCTYCGEGIPKGEVYQEQTGFWDGAAFRSKFHGECYQELCAEGEGEFTPFSEDRPVSTAGEGGAAC
jgi:hypothetical protein